MGVAAGFSLFKSSCVHRFLISGSDLRIDTRFSRDLTLELHRFLISSPNLGIDARISLFKPCCVHRFLISRLDLGIDARFSPFMHCCVHRFLISGPNLGIDAKKPSRTAQRLHRFLISGPDLGIDAAPSLLHRRIARQQRSRGVQAGTGWHEGGIILSKKPPEWRLSPPHQRSASDSLLRSSKEERPACSAVVWRLSPEMSMFFVRRLLYLWE